MRYPANLYLFFQPFFEFTGIASAPFLTQTRLNLLKS